jgi:hypothetical protein
MMHINPRIYFLNLNAIVAADSDIAEQTVITIIVAAGP